MANALTLIPGARQVALATYPDTLRHKCIFEVGSGSSDKIYRVSYDSAPGAGYWVCSCLGNLTRGNCRHLKAIGLPGRKEKGSLACKEWGRKLA